MALDRLNRFSVAPMLDWTDRHYRYAARLLTKHTLLYTEMVVDQTILLGKTAPALDYSAEEHPVALQLGGSNPHTLAQATRVASTWGYDQINLNLGCPSDKVQGGGFGACLMKTPQLVANCLQAMQEASNVPVTAKHRLGVDDLEDYGYLCDFVGTLANVGIGTFVVHARKALLKGLSPAQNRTVPPLRYDWVYRLKQDFPQLTIVINGGITTLEQAQQHLQQLDGVMVGRAAYENLYMLAEADAVLYGSNQPAVSREALLEGMKPYIEARMLEGHRLWSITKHLQSLYKGQKGARTWRRVLSEQSIKQGSGPEVLDIAYQAMLESIPEPRDLP